MILFLVAFVVAPLVIFGMLFFRRNRGIYAVALDVGLSLASLLVLVFILRWDMASVHLRGLIIPLFAVLAVIAYAPHRSRLAAQWSDLSRARKIKSVIFGAALPLLVLLGLAGRDTPPDQPVALQWPLERGTYFVAQGGNLGLYNHHKAVRAQQHALDITALGEFGRRSSGVLPDTFGAYYIYGRKILAPCDGVIASIETTVEQLATWSDNREQPAGNHVALTCGGVTVLMAHLSKVETLKRGEPVTAGTVLGRVGSTGNSTEPHLHIHAVSGANLTYEEMMFTGTGLEMSFSGRILRRNDIFKAGPQ